MVFCSKCGNKLNEEDAFCSSCGNKIVFKDDKKEQNNTLRVTESSSNNYEVKKRFLNKINLSFVSLGLWLLNFLIIIFVVSSFEVSEVYLFLSAYLPYSIFFIFVGIFLAVYHILLSKKEYYPFKNKSLAIILIVLFLLALVGILVILLLTRESHGFSSNIVNVGGEVSILINYIQYFFSVSSNFYLTHTFNFF